MQMHGEIMINPRIDRKKKFYGVNAKVKSTKKFEQLVRKSDQVLLNISSVFPFDFFPDSLVIDENKVNVIRRIFFFSEQIHTLAITNIKDVEVDTSVFLATLKLVPDGMPSLPVIVGCLKKSEAIKAGKIIQGLIVSKKEGVDFADIENPELPGKIESIGQVKEVL